MDFYFLLHFLVHDVHKVSVGWELIVSWELPLHGQTDILGGGLCLGHGSSQ